MRRFRVLVVMSVVGALLVGMGITPRPMLAASIEVGSSALYPCDRQGLSDAIQAAGSGGTVTFNCNPSEIDFYSGEQISISADVTIDGSNGSSDQIVLDGNEQTRFFDVTAGKLILQHITLRDGKADRGGAVRVGFIAGLIGELEAIDTTFISNQATLHGGAIYNADYSIITESSFTDNQALGDGGAIFGGGPLGITESSFTDNQAGDHGGAIYNHFLRDIFTQTTFTNNKADYGGAIYNLDAFLTISQSSFTENEAEFNGGAIWTGTSDITLTIIQSSFTENRAGSAGGAIYNPGPGHITVSQSSFTSNQAETDGGAIYDGGLYFTISQSSFTNNQAGTYGGAIFSFRFSAAIVQSSFINNQADSGGAIFIWAGPLAIAASTFSENTASGNGSAVYAGAGDITIAWSTIVQPEATTAAIFNASDLTLTGVILGGEGDHCSFYTSGSLSVTDTLANDDSCGRGATETWENQALLLGPLTTTTVNGVEQHYYGLLDGSPAIDNGPASCVFEFNYFQFHITVNTDQLDTPRPVNGACDSGAIEGLVFYPVELCANHWNGALSMPMRGDCKRNDSVIELPSDGPVSLCVNQWNGATRVADRCSRSERAITAIGDHSVPTCINRWNGALRVSDRCSRSEIADAI